MVLYGPPASGKSTIAARICERLDGARVLTSDEFRRKTYSRFLGEASRLIGRARYLILSGTFYRKRWRDEARRMAAERGESIVFIRLRCSLETSLLRNGRRPDAIDEKAVRIIHAEFEEGDEDLSVNTEAAGVDEAVEGIIEFILGMERSSRRPRDKDF